MALTDAEYVLVVPGHSRVVMGGQAGTIVNLPARHLGAHMGNIVVRFPSGLQSVPEAAFRAEATRGLDPARPDLGVVYMLPEVVGTPL